jgi:hypothetical protein
MHIHAARQVWTDDIAISLGRDQMGQLAVAKPLVFGTVGLGVQTDPAITLNITSAQRLMDELWQCGIRPSEGAGSAGAMAATQRHLEDMRTLVFKGRAK